MLSRSAQTAAPLTAYGAGCGTSRHLADCHDLRSKTDPLMRLATERCATIKSHSANFRWPDILEGRRTGLWLETANPSTRQYPREAQQECGLRRSVPVQAHVLCLYLWAGKRMACCCSENLSPRINPSSKSINSPPSAVSIQIWPRSCSDNEKEEGSAVGHSADQDVQVSCRYTEPQSRSIDGTSKHARAANSASGWCWSG